MVEGFRYNLAQLGKYEYVAETTVLRSTKDRPLYCLFYATRHEKGIEVFRDCQIEALKAQSKTRAATKVRHQQEMTGQGEIFESPHDTGPDDVTAYLDNERHGAEQSLLQLAPDAPDAIHYNKLWPRILSDKIVRRTDVNQIAGRLYREGKLAIPDWEKKKLVPQPTYRIQRPGK